MGRHGLAMLELLAFFLHLELPLPGFTLRAFEGHERGVVQVIAGCFDGGRYRVIFEIFFAKSFSPPL